MPVVTPTKLFVTESASDPGQPQADGVAASSTNTYYSKVFRPMPSWSMQVQTTGTLTGTWTLWGSNKPGADPASDTDWVDLSSHAGFVETNPAGAATNWLVTPDHLTAYRLKLKYVNASGTGNLFAYVVNNAS